ncbi:hypothetical protein C493_07384 [Natronolimnohabitans innermongolicus JCM 12255]|uniref:Uncharacterized protein n=1 Tax=Natronolimnohabitans innermongolicus JCM 12255 TaxID=1227499 RepID=L9X7J2_9EURY|nr:hypothetical protein C493_07384 [Natronolimnohabitans innermongolicus JCM 12255]
MVRLPADTCPNGALARSVEFALRGRFNRASDFEQQRGGIRCSTGRTDDLARVAPTEDRDPFAADQRRDLTPRVMFRSNSHVR